MKKFLSIILATAILISLVPAAFASDATETSHVETYDFAASQTTHLVSVNKGANYVAHTVGDATYYILKDFHTTYTENNWKWLATNDETIAKGVKAQNVFRVFKDSSSSFLQLELNRNVTTYTGTQPKLALALAFKAPEKKSAFYYPTLYTRSGYTTSTEFYLRSLNENRNGMGSIGYYTDSKYKSTNIKNSNVFKVNSAIYTALGDEFVLGITGNNNEYRFDYLTLTQILAPNVTLNEASYALDIADADTSNDTASVSATVTGKTVIESTETDVSLGVAKEFLTYKTGDASVATVSVDGTLTAVGGGTTTVWAETADGTYASAPATVTVTAPVPEPEEDPNLKAAFDAVPVAKNDYVAPTVVGLGFDGTVMKAEDNRNGTFTLTAEKTKDEGEKFLYWAVGNTDKKRIISFNNVITNYVPAEQGRNYLIAVYEGDIASDKNEYYNQNGQLIAKQTSAPDYPAMAGYGTAKSWEQYGDTNIYVAQYDKTEDDRDEVTVTVIDGNGGGTVPFGGSVTCTATGENFKCWKKTNINGDEIVSVDATYTFKAWENCTVTAVYEVHTPLSTAMKIIIDDFAVGSETGIMAEFIGIKNAVEKGIMFDDGENVTKIAMTTSGNQFTVIADKAGEYIGYAILEDGDAYSIITDGSYTKEQE